MLDFYTVKTKYIRNLMNIDHQNIISVSPQHRKNRRLFIGIIVMINSRQYCIPLSSIEGKNKYLHMKENITFRKIRNPAGKIIGVLNINNMIPVRKEYLIPFNIQISPTDTPKQRQYKLHCKEELDWCRQNEKEITMLARTLYQMVSSDQTFKKRKICPDYLLLERECDKGKTV